MTQLLQMMRKSRTGNARFGMDIIYDHPLGMGSEKRTYNP